MAAFVSSFVKNLEDLGAIFGQQSPFLSQFNEASVWFDALHRHVERKVTDLLNHVKMVSTRHHLTKN